MLIIGICLIAVYKMMDHGKKMQNFARLVEKLVLMQNFFAYNRLSMQNYQIFLCIFRQNNNCDISTLFQSHDVWKWLWNKVEISQFPLHINVLDISRTKRPILIRIGFGFSKCLHIGDLCLQAIFTHKRLAFKRRRLYLYFSNNFRLDNHSKTFWKT